MAIRIIITGATGMVGEGVLLSCLKNQQVDEVLTISRKSAEISHPKLKELVVADFNKLDDYRESLTGYDACFYCAGVSSVGMSESDYTAITYDTTLTFATALKKYNPNLVFTFLSGAHTDSTAAGKVMWARVKGKTENALISLFPGHSYNFRPGLMKPVEGQKHLKGFNRYIKILLPAFRLFFPLLTLDEVARAMIRVTTNGYDKSVMEVADIRIVASQR